MTKIIHLVARLKQDQRGITAVEYAVLAAMVGTAIVGLSGTFSSNLGNAFTNIFNP